MAGPETKRHRTAPRVPSAPRVAGSSPWSNRRLDLVQVLAAVVGPHGVERAGLIQARENLIRQRRQELVGLLRNAHRQLGQSAWRNRMDKRTRGVVDPVHVLGLVFGRPDRLAALQLAGEVERTAVPERDVAEHAGHAPVLVDHGAELPVAQTRHHRPHPHELACIRRHEGAIHDDETNYLDGGAGLGDTGTIGGREFIESMCPGCAPVAGSYEAPDSPLGCGRPSQISASIETDTFDNERPQGGFFDRVTLVEVDGTYRLAVQTRVEEPFRILQLGTFWKRQPHRVLEGLADADDAVVGPDGHPLGAGGLLPLHLFDYARVRALDKSPQLAQPLTPPAGHPAARGID